MEEEPAVAATAATTRTTQPATAAQPDTHISKLGKHQLR